MSPPSPEPSEPKGKAKAKDHGGHHADKTEKAEHDKHREEKHEKPEPLFLPGTPSSVGTGYPNPDTPRSARSPTAGPSYSRYVPPGGGQRSIFTLSVAAFVFSAKPHSARSIGGPGTLFTHSASSPSRVLAGSVGGAYSFLAGSASSPRCFVPSQCHASRSEPPA